jgi:2-dehydro-3-deoxyphosphogluconate aldolase/(4S)-4-hydroxy-2-oxoglutarate aldolase
MSAVDAIAALGRGRVLPILRSASAEEAVGAAARLAAAGIEVIELTTTTPGWEAALAGVRAAHPATAIGVGTIADARLAERALARGAAFLVSPWPVPDVRPLAAEAGVPLLEGGFTPGEVADATSRGVAKLFPAHVGGPQYLRGLLAVLPGRRIVPTGGIALAAVGDWLEAGAYAVGVGSDLLRVEDVGAAVAAAVAGAGAGGGVAPDAPSGGAEARP